ncbi:MAG: nodulation protein NfeD [Actinobacteria bacterium]|nr:MAG: nodulation protein NfeD [Actinomycetota bacterium]
MKAPILRAFFSSLAVFLTVPALALAGSSTKSKVLVIHFALEVNPVTSSYLDHQLHRAQDGHYNAAVIEIDTPGGLSESMRTIVKTEVGLKIPVVVYVSPQGSRAASAGVWITEAGDIAAMAPQTKASNLFDVEAKQMNVVDVVAPRLPDLLNKIDGRTTVGKKLTLHTAGAELVQVHPGFFTRLLNALIDPNLIPLLFLAGLAGIGFEIFHPGVVLPGALGAVSLLLALFGFAVLPISWAGLALLILGAALLVIDAHVVTHGALTVAGLISLVVGSLLLFHNAPAPYDNVNTPLLVAFAIGLGAIWAVAIGKAMQVRRSPVSVGPQTIVGEVGEARRDDLVFVHGELWRARATDGEPLQPGQQVRVSGVDPELVLEVVHVGAE